MRLTVRLFAAAAALLAVAAAPAADAAVKTSPRPAKHHGTVADRDGTRILPVPLKEDGKRMSLTGFFPPRGHAVVMKDLRGTGVPSAGLASMYDHQFQGGVPPIFSGSARSGRTSP